MVTTSSTVDLPLTYSDQLWENWLKEVVALEKRILGHISIQWQSDDELLVVNRQFLDHDYYTDIITFDRNRGSRVHGDLAISVDRVVDHAITQNIPLRDEFLRVVVHGVLHLCGHEDHTDEEKTRMRRLESGYIQMASKFGL